MRTSAEQRENAAKRAAEAAKTKAKAEPTVVDWDRQIERFKAMMAELGKPSKRK